MSIVPATSLTRAIREALRTKLLTVVRVTSGPQNDISVDAPSFTYTRVAGSFLTDGWYVNDECTGSGFADAGNNAPHLVVNVTDKQLTVSVPTGAPALVTKAAGANVSLIATLPQNRAAERRAITAANGLPYLQEVLIPASSLPLTIGPRKRIENRGLYQVSLFYPSNYGVNAQDAMADAVVDAFYPGQVLSAQGVNVTVVSARRAQAVPDADYASVPITIAYKVFTLTP